MKNRTLLEAWSEALERVEPATMTARARLLTAFASSVIRALWTVCTCCRGYGVVSSSSIVLTGQTVGTGSGACPSIVSGSACSASA